MAFQFHCPQGHLLSAQEFQAGQQTNCPVCGIVLIIPLPAGMAPPAPAPVVPYGPAPVVPYGPAPTAPYPPAPVMPYAADPTPPAPPAMPPSAPIPPMPPAPEPEMPTDRFAALAAAAQAAESESQAEKPPEPATEAPPVEPAVLHIPCPKGHVLETPEDMLDQDVLCPHCRTQFVLRRRNSVEYRQKKEEEERQREIRVGNFWLNMAIVTVVLVVLGLVALIVVRSLMHTPMTK